MTVEPLSPKPAVTVSLDGRGGILLHAPTEENYRAAALPTARWINAAKAWRFAATPACAMNLIESGLLADDFIPEWLDRLALPIATADVDRRAYADLANESTVALRIGEGYEFGGGATTFADRYRSMWPHQRAAYWWASTRPAALLDAHMGTGKTRVAIEVCNDDPAARVVFVSTPLSTIPHWRAQILRFSVREPLIVDLTGDSTRRASMRAADAIAKFDGSTRQLWLLCNRERTWRSPLNELMLRVPPDVAIYDEVHSIKATSGRASLHAAALGKIVRRRIGLSGTPLAHSPLDAYGIFRFLDPGVFGLNYASFRNRFAVMGGFKDHQVIGFRNMDEFRQRYLWLTFEVRADVLDLPANHHVEHEIRLPPRAREVYNGLRDEFVAELDGGGVVTASNALAKLLRLQQVTSGFAPRDDDGRTDNSNPLVEIHEEKRRAVYEMLEELPADERLVVFCRFTHDLDSVHLAARSAGASSCELSGRRKDLALWEATDGTAPRVIAVQIQAGGLGVDSLKIARHCVFYSLGFSLAEYEQALARVLRPGQERTVYYHHLIAVGTVDRHVYRALRARRDVLDDVLQRRKIEED